MPERERRARETFDYRDDHGPFDIIGDVHGCADELRALLAILGYRIEQSDGGTAIAHPERRRLVFAGDLVNRGPNTPEVLRLALAAVAAGGHAVEGNHDQSLSRAMAGEGIAMTKALEDTLAQFAAETPAFRAEALAFLAGLSSYCWFDAGRLAVAHAGLKEEMIGRPAEAVRPFSVHGDTARKTDANGLPLLSDWVFGHRGSTVVAYGHTPVTEPEWVNNTICLDTGCVAGGRLTALRWPERELVGVPARRVYAKPARPFVPAGAVGA
jgi:protein phosphatase